MGARVSKRLRSFEVRRGPFMPPGIVNYCQVTCAPAPTKFAKVPLSDPPIFGSGAVNVELALPEPKLRMPMLLPVVAGNWLRIDVGTVNVPAPAVVKQLNVADVTVVLAPVPVEVEDEPTI